MFLQNIAAGVGIVPRHRIEDFPERQIVLSQEPRFDQHLVLLDVPAHRIDVDDLRCAFQNGPNHPILDRPLRDQVLMFHFRIDCGSLRRVQVILKHLAQTGTVRHQHGFGTGRELFFHFKQTLQHQLPGQVDVHGVVEHDRNERQPDFCEGTHFRERGNARELKLDRIGHQPFHLGRREAGGLGHHLHQHAGDVRKRIDRNRPEGIHPSSPDHEGTDDD